MANRDILELVFKHSGGVEIRAIPPNNGREESSDVDTIVWASDSDPEFMDRFGQELLEPEADSEEVIDYLLEADVLDEDEVYYLRIFSESLDGRDIEAGPGEDDDDDGGEDDDEIDR